MVGESEGRITDQTRITRSRASVRAGVTTSSKPRQLDLERTMDTNLDNGYIEEFSCCNKSFVSLRGLKIHQAKVCKKEVLQRRSVDQETCGSIRQETNHRTNHTTAAKKRHIEVSERKPKTGQKPVKQENTGNLVTRCRR